MRFTLLILAGSLFLPASLLASVIDVPEMYPTIQAAVDACCSGDMIQVAEGTYAGAGNRDLQLRGKAMTICSVGGPSRTTIDCQGTLSEPHRAFLFTGSEPAGAEVVLEGFTIVNGYGANGGAVLCTSGSSPTIVDCVFRGSTATFGGGAVCVQGAAPTFARCSFGANTAGAGGAVHVTGGGSASFDHCAFSQNTAATGGALWIRGGWMDVVSCTLYGNVARYRGAAIFVRDGVSLDLTNTIIAYQGIGGAVWCEGNASSVSAACSDVYGNVGGDWTGCLAGLGSLNGNFSNDPRFCLSPGFELYLQQGSPCLRSTGCGMVGAFNTGCLSRYESELDRLKLLSGSLPGELTSGEGVPISWGALKAELHR